MFAHVARTHAGRDRVDAQSLNVGVGRGGAPRFEIVRGSDVLPADITTRLDPGDVVRVMPLHQTAVSNSGRLGHVAVTGELGGSTTSKRTDPALSARSPSRAFW